jgi:TetR/AcrR family transcriptional regulator, transcriptional repressor for nem operon
MNPPASVDTRQQILDTARAIIAGKGFAAVGLSEILAAAGVPKGSFYHWFRSKDQFGEALLQRHFESYLQQVDASLGMRGRSAPERLLDFFGQWHALQSGDDPQARCLVVKLSAEVCDLSEPMRVVLERGTAQVVAQLESCLSEGIAAGELANCADPGEVALQLYQQWLGATLMARVTRSAEPLHRVLAQTSRWIAGQTSLV